MNLNATLFVQIAHFWVAYLIIRYFVLKPLFQALAADQQSYQSLITMIERLKSMLGEKEREKRELVESAKHFFGQHAPRPDVAEYSKPDSAEQHMRVGPEKQLDRASVERAKELLIKRILDV